MPSRQPAGPGCPGLWVRMDGEQATLGLTEVGQAGLGAITYVELRKVGTRVRRGGILGIIESIKTATDLVAPLSGRIARVNPAVIATPELINQDPRGAGWLCELDLAAPLPASLRSGRQPVPKKGLRAATAGRMVYL